MVQKNDKKKSTRYDLNTSLKTSKVSARFIANVYKKEGRFIIAKTTLDYNVVKGPKNKILFSGKLNDRSTKSYTKFSFKR